MTHTSTEQPEALPCPFCGGHSTLDSNGQDFRVFCWDCGAKSKEFDCWQKAEAAWNRRTPASQARVPLSEDLEKLAINRYRVVQSHESIFHRWAVVAGDGKQQLYTGREIECMNMAQKFMGAFLDGAFVAAHGITQEKQG